MELGDDTKVVLLAGGLIFLWAMVLGVIKYRQMLASEEGHAHFYIDTAHRAALLYAFACVLIAAFVELSEWSTAVNLIAAGAMLFFFVTAIGNYMIHGLKGDTDNQVRDRVSGMEPYMVALISAEIGGWAVLLAGFVAGQIL